MFAQWFSTKEFDEDKTVFWRGGLATKSDIDEACHQLNIPAGNMTADDMATAVVNLYKNPASWKRISKCCVDKLDGDNPMATGLIEDFEKCQGEIGHIENMPAFVANVKNNKCIARVFVLQSEYSDDDVTVVTDPTDTTVIGWYFHQD